VDEFWVCGHCRSLNRVGSTKCYSCREKFGSRPPTVETLRSPGSGVGAAPPPPPMPAVPMADFSSSRNLPPPPSFSRPVAVPPPAMPGRHAPAIPREPGGSLNPVTAIRQKIARSLAMRQSVSVAPLGYLTALLLVIVLVIGVVLVMTVLPVGTYMLQHLNLKDSWAQLSDGEQGLTKQLSIALLILSPITLLFFSVFVGLSTHNATGLGADQPLLPPYRAGTAWTGVIWAQTRIVVGLLVPAALLWEGYTIVGLILAIVSLEIAHHHLDDAGGWLERPARHLADLYAKLGFEGSIASPAGSVWSACFRGANWMFIGVAALPVVGYAAYVGSNLAGRPEVIGWGSSSLGIAQIAVALMVSSFIGLTVATVALLIPLTIGLVQRQRTRKTLVRVGRARSWVARPGEGSYANQGAGAQGPEPVRYGGFDDEDRIVERRPGYGPDPSSSSLGGPGFGAAVPSSPFANPNQGDPRLGGPGSGFAGPFANPNQGGDPRLGGPGPGQGQGPGPNDPSFGGSDLISDRRPGDPSQGGSGQGGWG
jgi:hypothetical protein